MSRSGSAAQNFNVDCIFIDRDDPSQALYQDPIAVVSGDARRGIRSPMMSYRSRQRRVMKNPPSCP